MILESEYARYRELLPDLLQASEGKYVVIKGGELLGIFDDYDVAYSAGLAKYGFTSFLLTPVRAKDPVVDLTNLRLGIVRGEV